MGNIPRKLPRGFSFVFYPAELGCGPILREVTDMDHRHGKIGLKSIIIHFLEMGSSSVQINPDFLCREEGVEQQTWFLLDGQHTWLLNQGLEIVEYKTTNNKACVKLYSNSQ